MIHVVVAIEGPSLRMNQYLRGRVHLILETTGVRIPVHCVQGIVYFDLEDHLVGGTRSKCCQYLSLLRHYNSMACTSV